MPRFLLIVVALLFSLSVSAQDNPPECKDTNATRNCCGVLAISACPVQGCGGDPELNTKKNRIDVPADSVVEQGRRLLERAAARIGDDRVRADFLDRPVYAGLHTAGSAGARKSQARLVTLYDMIRVLNSEPDADDLAREAEEALRGATVSAIEAVARRRNKRR